MYYPGSVASRTSILVRASQIKYRAQIITLIAPLKVIEVILMRRKKRERSEKSKKGISIDWTLMNPLMQLICKV